MEFFGIVRMKSFAYLLVMKEEKTLEVDDNQKGCNYRNTKKVMSQIWAFKKLDFLKLDGQFSFMLQF